MRIVDLLRSSSELYSTTDIAAPADAAASGQNAVAIVLILVAVVALAVATTAGRMLAVAIAAAIRTVIELVATLARLAGMSAVAVILIGILLYGMLH